jgi:hypothetical protein
VSVRTTTVVGTGLAALAFIGVATIFGESLSALVAPAPAMDNANPAHTAGVPGRTTTAPPTGAAAAKAGGDGGTIQSSADGSS